MSRTPILDGEVPLPVRKVRWVPALLVGVALGGVLIAVERVTGSRVSRVPLESIPIAIAAFYIAVFAHESGHLLAGLLKNFEPRTFMVGAFLFSKEAGTWRFRIRPRYLLFGGLTAAQPVSDQRLLNRFVFFVAGGPAASLALLIITALLPGGSATRILFWINLLLLISVFIPHTTACLPNDSKLILLLSRPGPVSDRLVATLYLLALDGQGMEPQEWPRHWLDKIETDTKDKSRMPQALAFLLADAAEHSDAERTANMLERALSLCGRMLPAQRRSFLTAASCHHGFHRGDAARAEQCLRQAQSVKGGASQKDWDAQALAAISFANREHGKAIEMLDRYIGLLDRQATSGMVTAERRRVVELRDSLKAEASLPTVPQRG